MSNATLLSKLLSKKEVRLGLVDFSLCNSNYILILMVLRGTKSIDGLVIEESSNIETLTYNVNKNSILQEVNVIIFNDVNIMDKVRRIFTHKYCIPVNNVPDSMALELSYFIKFLKRVKEEYLELRGCRQTK